MELEIGHLGVLLLEHPKHRLVKIAKNLEGSDFNASEFTKEELVEYIERSHTFNDVQKSFKNGLFSSPGVVYFYNLKPDQNRKKIPSSLSRIKANLKNYNKLLKTGEKPTRFSAQPSLIRVFEWSNRYYFLFAGKGRKSFQKKGFKLKEITEPRFEICVWDSPKSILQIRTAHNTAFYHNFFLDLLTNSPRPLSKPLDITQTLFPQFVTAINGTVRTVKGKSRTRTMDYLTKEYKSRPRLDIRQVASYSADLQGYDIISHAVEFDYNGDDYSIYVNFSKGSFWIRKGDPNEEVYRYVQDIVDGLN